MTCACPYPECPYCTTEVWYVLVRDRTFGVCEPCRACVDPNGEEEWTPEWEMVEA